jgi:5'-3' exonuclease
MHAHEIGPTCRACKRKPPAPSTQLGLDFSAVLAEREAAAHAAVDLQAPPQAVDLPSTPQPEPLVPEPTPALPAVDVWPADPVPWSAPPSGDPQVVLLVDAPSILEQCAHIPKLRQIVGPNGQPAGLVRGFARALLRLLGQHKPQLVAVIFEHPDGAQRRLEILGQDLPTKELDLELMMQTEVSRTLAELLGCATIASTKGEAMDVIGTLASRCPADWPVIVASQRTQLLQLGQRKDLAMTYWLAGEQLTEHASVDCRRRLRVEAHQVVAYQGLTSLRGIGEASAREILQAVDPEWIHGRRETEARLMALVEHDSFGIAAGLSSKMRGRIRVAQALRDGREELKRAMLAARLVRDLDESGEVPTSEEVGDWLIRREMDQERLKLLGDAWGIKELRGDYEISAQSND